MHSRFGFKDTTVTATERELVTSYYNDGLPDDYSTELDVKREVESVMLNGDTALLNRGFQNLIGKASGITPGMQYSYSNETVLAGAGSAVWDSGAGIPAAVIKTLNSQKTDPEKHPHVMGLRVVKTNHCGA